MAFKKSEFDSPSIIIDPNLGIYADSSALSDEQYYLYKSRHLDKQRQWSRLDLLPYELYKFNRDLKIAEYFIISQREKAMREYTRLNLLYTSSFATKNFDAFIPTLTYTTHPYLQGMIFNYFRTKSDTSNLVNYIRRTIRKLSNYGLCQRAEAIEVPLPFEEQKNRIKAELLKNSEKRAQQLRNEQYQAL